MANSLQEQLLKAGLVKEQQVRQARSDKRKDRKRGGEQAGRQQREVADVRRKQSEQRERDRQLNAEIEQKKQSKEAKQRARQLARQHSLNKQDAEVAFNFVRDGAIKRIYVTEEQRARLVAAEIQAVMPSCFVYRVEDDGGDTDVDDAYAEYKVPDDLMW